MTGFESNRWRLALAWGASAWLLAACSSVSLQEPAPVRTATPTQTSRPSPASFSTATPASAPAGATTEAPVAVATPIAPRNPLQAAPLDPAEPQITESAGVAARFPDPQVDYLTPAFAPGRTAFTSNAELQAFLHQLVRGGESTGGALTVRLVAAGSSQSGVPLEALLLTRDGAEPGRTTRPTVLLVGQQHGDEPAGSEALLVIAQELAVGRLQPLLDRINVLILPRANPDGAAAYRRVTASGIDANRDHLLLRTPETQAQAQLIRDYAPVVVVDAHEYSVLGRYVDKFGAVQRYDAMLQYAMTANMAPFVSKASEEWFRGPLLKALKDKNLSAEWYYTTSTDLADKKVSMGGVQPDTGRNVNGLRHAVSFLIETRGIGLGRAHFARRVYTHVTAIESILASTAARSADLIKLRQFVEADVASQACRGEAVVEAAATPSEYTLLMLDPATGADKKVPVTWDSALELTTLKKRARPCGYWLRADQIDAVLRLRGLGVQVAQFDEAIELRGESYRETARETGVRSDVRGNIADGGSVVRVKVATTPALIDVPAGSYYVGLDQPLANLVIAALEPDTQNSYLTNGIVSAVDGEARVLARPAVKMTALP